MPKIKFVGTWDPQLRSLYKYPASFLMMKPKEMYVKDMKAFFQKLTKWQKKEIRMRDLDITIEYHYRKRTFDQNALMWSLYAIEAHEFNNGLGDGVQDHMITPERIYSDDLMSFGPTITVTVSRDEYEMLTRTYQTKTADEQEDGQIRAVCIITSSYWNTKQMSEWIEMIFNRIAFAGVTLDKSADIKKYWVQWREHVNEEKIAIDDTPMTVEDYKTLHPICAATGTFIGHGGGSLAHIKAVGMGGPRSNMIFPSNSMHLTDTAHAEFDNGKGRDVFLKNYKHMKYKIETALRREYPEVE